MPRPFSPATAEQLVAVIEAVVASQGPVLPQFVADFADLTQGQSESALQLATDLGLLRHMGGRYSVASPLCRFLLTPNLAQRAAVVRVALESYPPFLTFRQRLMSTANASTAAQQTKVALDLEGHREVIKDTLVNLGTYSDALITEGGGRYAPQPAAIENSMQVLAIAAGNLASAEARIRQQLGNANGVVSRDEVVVPLSSALLRARDGDGRGAVVESGNAVESYLTALAGRVGIGLTGATGLNAKLDKFDNANWLPKKLVFVGKYLGHIRNAADHGIDPSINAAWTIRVATGLEYVFVACSFIAAVTAKERNEPAEI